MTIPDRWTEDWSAYWEILEGFVAVDKVMHGRTVTFIVEPVREGFRHHCTVQDILRILWLLPPDHVAYIPLIVLRQPTKKQGIMAPVWGRLGYWSKIGSHQGAALYLEAQPSDRVVKWDKRLAPDRKRELERLRQAGFRIDLHSRGYDVCATPESIRALQLFHTVPHEFGHYDDYEASRRTFEWGDDDARFWELYGAKSSREKEVYAHRYADRFRAKMTESGKLPFVSRYHPRDIRDDGLVPEWFYPFEVTDPTRIV